MVRSSFDSRTVTLLESSTGDTTPTTTPPGLAANVFGDGETWLDWAASTDNATPCGLITCEVYRVEHTVESDYRCVGASWIRWVPKSGPQDGSWQNLANVAGGPAPEGRRVDDEVLTTQDLLEQWREATRAAELAERLAKLAAESAERAEQAAAGGEEIARMAERAAKAAERAARSARKAANRAVAFARESRGVTVADADQTLVEARAEESAAAVRYHHAEQAARTRHGG